ncbi:ABC transporter permease subunit [candidate division KSB3 bacterium]|uniref:ABC transporter permease subunit n=1 Tax=candidate division KSB3 bacterium TaxID=2044937 RepID=A0A9D5Q5P3_9BACT|nr:ABC transporter permease subunit [candidate division KSB3 bacterium]MBD3324840.1 ABC transporter permease subunit [candidate division KSB3 bacterium]
MCGMYIRDRYKGYFFILPAFLLLIAILGFPAVAAILQSVNLMWVIEPAFSVTSYQRLVRDPEFLRSLLNTVIFVSATVGFHLLLGLSVALLLNAQIKGKHLFRVIAILPWTVPDVIGGLIWRFMFDTLPGIVNAILLKTGMIIDPIDWLGNPNLAFPCVIFAETWRGYPFAMLILLAGLQAIPQEQYEAAEIDGASKIQSFFYITIPNLKYMFIIALVLDTIWECRLFGMVYSMTGGGPGYSSQVLSVLTYKHYFLFFNTSYAAAIAVVLATLMLLISIPYLRMTMKREL